MPPIRLEQIRKERGLARSAVAHHLDISERHLFRLERGVTPLKRGHLLALAEVYEMTASELSQEVAA